MSSNTEIVELTFRFIAQSSAIVQSLMDWILGYKNVADRETAQHLLEDRLKALIPTIEKIQDYLPPFKF